MRTRARDIGVDFGLAAKSMSESLRNIQWIDSLKRNGLKGGSASDGQGGLHPIEVRVSIGCAFACASNGSFQLHPMDIKSRKRRDRMTRPPCASQHRRSAHAFNHHDNGFILTFRTYGRYRAGSGPKNPTPQKTLTLQGLTPQFSIKGSPQSSIPLPKR